MYASKLLMPAALIPIGRIRNTHDLFALVPVAIHRLLLVIDPSHEPESAVTIAFEVAERWGPQITLVHGGKLSNPRMGEEQSEAAALADLLCLSWQVKEAYRDVSISQRLPDSLAEILEEARRRKADLIMLAKEVAAGFGQSELTMFGGSNLVSPCPIVVVMPPASNWFNSELAEYR